MNRQDIIRIATAAGAVFDGSNWSIKADFDEDELCNFARLIAEDCAKRCDAEFWAATKRDGATAGVAAGNCADAIREAYKP